MARPRTLRERREALDLTQGQLAELLGVRRLYVLRIEAGQAEPPSWYPLALRGIEENAAAGNLVVPDRRPPGRPRRPTAELLED